jgi:hypothetical protein
MPQKTTAALFRLFFSNDDLVRPVSLEQAESLFSVTVKRLGDAPVPFGALNSEWRKLVRKMSEGDVLWEFAHKGPDGTVFRGVKLVRGRQVIDAIVASASSDPRDES